MFNSEAMVEEWKHLVEYALKTHMLTWNFSFNHSNVKILYTPKIIIT